MKLFSVPGLGVPILLLCLLLVACAGTAVKPGSAFRTSAPQGGGGPHNRGWEAMLERQLSAELKGEDAPPGFVTWNEKWIWHLNIIEMYQDDANVYIDQVIEARRARGLPELYGYVKHSGSDQSFEALNPDTRERFDEFRELHDVVVELERNGAEVPQSLRSWGDFWMTACLGLYRHQKNPGKYMGYIISARRAAGLPELEAHCIPGLNHHP